MQVRTCEKCQRGNSTIKKSTAPLHPIPVKPKEWHQVGIDLVGPFTRSCSGNQYIAVMSDYFTKWVEAAPLPDKSAASIAQFIYSVICRMGCPSIMISDQGKEFVNNLNKELCQKTGIEHRIASAYHPQTNGLTERMNQTLQRSLAKLCEESKDDWDTKVDSILMGYRAAKQASTKYSPFYLIHKWDMRLPVDVNVGTMATSEEPGTSGISLDDNSAHTDSVLIDETVQQSLDLRKAVFSKVDKNILKEQTKQKNRYDNCLPKVHRFAVSVLLPILYLPPASYISGMHMFIYILSCFAGW
jgi:hypothetical protein